MWIFINSKQITHGQSCCLLPPSTISSTSSTWSSRCSPFPLLSLLHKIFTYARFLVLVLEATFYVPSSNLPAKRCRIIVPLYHYHICIMEGQHGKLFGQMISSFRHCHLYCKFASHLIYYTIMHCGKLWERFHQSKDLMNSKKDERNRWVNYFQIILTYKPLRGYIYVIYFIFPHYCSLVQLIWHTCTKQMRSNLLNMLKQYGDCWHWVVQIYHSL